MRHPPSRRPRDDCPGITIADLEIRLRAEAFIGRVVATSGQWAFFDTANRPVALAEVMAQPERIGAVYFVDDELVTPCHGTFSGGTFRGDSAFREFFLCNEAMSEGWSAGTPEILAHLQASIAALRELSSALPGSDCSGVLVGDPCWVTYSVAAWADPPADLLGRFRATLAFPNELYQPTRASVDDLVARLNALIFTPDPVVHMNTGDAAP